jgi:hypothetical protein
VGSEMGLVIISFVMTKYVTKLRGEIRMILIIHWGIIGGFFVLVFGVVVVFLGEWWSLANVSI